MTGLPGVSKTVVKLVKADWTTHGGQRWEIGKTVSIPKSRRGTELCSSQVLHAYHGVEQALLMDPAHGDFGDSGRLMRATGLEIVADDGTKLGLHEITLIEEIERPTWWLDPRTRLQVQVQFAVLCARAVLHIYEDRYPKDDLPRKAIEAAETYLTGKPTDVGAYAANAAARAAARAAAYAAEHIDTHALAIESVRLITEHGASE